MSQTIESQRQVACGAFIFYPLLGLIFRNKWIAAYSIVYSSFHSLYAYNLEKQINEYFIENYRSSTVGYVGKKYRVYKNKIIFEDKNLLNFYYPVFEDNFKKNSNINHINLHTDDLTKINQILEYRRNRFRTILSVFICAITTYEITSKMTTRINGRINTLFLCARLYALCQTKSPDPSDENFFITNANHRYYFVDCAGNIKFTNKFYGARKRYYTKKPIDFTAKQGELSKPSSESDIYNGPQFQRKADPTNKRIN